MRGGIIRVATDMIGTIRPAYPRWSGQRRGAGRRRGDRRGDPRDREARGWPRRWSSCCRGAPQRPGGLPRPAGRAAESLTGLPGWAALAARPAERRAADAVIGMYWDISLHIDNGRDPGPLANPAHYLILFGLFGVFAAGLLRRPAGARRPARTAVRFGEGWYAPFGGAARPAGVRAARLPARRHRARRSART